MSPWTYAYDPLARITSYTPPSAGSSQSYTWAGLPDRASITSGSTTNALTYDAASRPTADSVNGAGAYTSDKEGRLRAMPGDRRLVYNTLGQLTKVTTSADAVIASYTYDALDRLRTVSETGNTTRFLYVGLSNAVAQEQSGTGAVIVSHATDMAGTDLFDFSGTSVLGYLYRNAHSDVNWVGSASGAVAATAVYDPFGNLSSSASTNMDSGNRNYRWQSSWQDPATGLYYVVARWYSPTMGTFLSEDPLAHDQADPQSRDPYAYGSGDPVDQVDPSGETSSATALPYDGEPLGVPFFSQKNPWTRWSNKPLAPKGSTCTKLFSQAGCLVTSMAMVLNYLWVTLPVNGNEQEADPLSLDLWLQSTKVLSPKTCNTDWSSGKWQSRLGFHWKTLQKGWVGSWQAAQGRWFNTIDKELRNGNPLIAEVAWGKGALTTW